MAYQDLLFEKRDNVGIITLNRPEKFNAISMNMVDELEQVADEIMKDDDVRSVVLTGSGKGFCSGVDLTSRPAGEARPEPARHEKLDPLKWIGRWCLAMYNIEKPTIAAVNGVAAGAGFSLSLTTDIRIASEDARFTVVFIRRALSPDSGATYFLPRIVGRSKAFEMCYTGDIVDAKEAERIGLVSRVVPADKLMDETMALAKRLADGPPIAMQLTKRCLNRSLDNDLRAQLEEEALLVAITTATEDVREGIAAFREKRAPVFKGR